MAYLAPDSHPVWKDQLRAGIVELPTAAAIGDTLGRKKIYVIGFTVFIIGSVLAGIAWNLGSMIVFRVIQAIAGSADYPTAMAILAITFKQGKERAQALGIWSSSFAAASVFGPLLGGPLIDHFGIGIFKHHQPYDGAKVYAALQTPTPLPQEVACA